LTALQSFTAQDRVLVIAPHPDDEAIATGGVLQVARAAGAASRVLVITDGDNNPWPQRWIEKRWHIGAAERARWGAERRSEAVAALQVLGLQAADVRCLGFPDLGLTDGLLRGEPALGRTLAAQLDEFRPSCLFLPALDDRHPDHSALHVLLQLALPGYSGPPPSLYTFGVHGEASSGDDVILALTDAQCDTKRAAIMSHQTQMRLSQRRFVAYARVQEPYRIASVPGVPDPQHPVQAGLGADGKLRVRIDRARWHSLRGQALSVVLRRADGGSMRCRIMLSGASRGEVVDTATNAKIGMAAIEASSTETDIILTIASDAVAGWIKLSRPDPGLFVLDRFGWQTIAVGEAERARRVG
jgi:LmbE family N-acetylglucosaminyl deacetylase